jgi:hypothetical protein
MDNSLKEALTKRLGLIIPQLVCICDCFYRWQKFRWFFATGCP